jgi:hypothetical protein
MSSSNLIVLARAVLTTYRSHTFLRGRRSFMLGSALTHERSPLACQRNRLGPPPAETHMPVCDLNLFDIVGRTRQLPRSK